MKYFSLCIPCEEDWGLLGSKDFPSLPADAVPEVTGREQNDNLNAVIFFLTYFNTCCFEKPDYSLHSVCSEEMG